MASTGLAGYISLKTNIAGWEIHHLSRCISPINNGGFSIAMLVYQSVYIYTYKYIIYIYIDISCLEVQVDHQFNRSFGKDHYFRRALFHQQVQGVDYWALMVVTLTYMV